MDASPPQRHWLKSLLRTRTLVAALVIVCLVALTAAYITITRHAKQGAPDARIIIVLILLILSLLLVLGAMVARRAVRLWASLREGSVGSRLQTRIVAMFTLVTIVPTLIVSVFSTLFFNFGIQSWFDERVSTALDESVAVAQAYLEEHRDVIRGDALAMANDLDHDLRAGILVSPGQFNAIVETQVRARILSEAVVIQKGRVLAQSQLSFSLVFERLSSEQMERADRGEVVVQLEGNDKVRALVRLKSLPDTYLFIGRFVDEKVLEHMDSATGSVRQYRRLKDGINQLQIEFIIVFVMLALTLLCTAVWYGMTFASKLVVPVTRLVKAAERVRGGDFTVRVEEGPKDDEVGTLARAFNRMTDELDKQRGDLMDANRQLDARRRFTEAVLSGVSAGVVALSPGKIVTIANPIAASLLLMPEGSNLRGQPLLEIAPEFAELLRQAEPRSAPLAQGDITITRNDRSHVLHVRVAVERAEGMIDSYIITFDDITQLLVAQRSAAWADVARRVAHEIKNPLTPIQLSAERLRKKYQPADPADAETFLRYTETIVRHVGDIGKIVEEFAAFARMPAPQMRREDVVPILRKAVFSEHTAHPDIAYTLDLPDHPVYLLCDEQQISRVLLNLLKNSAEAFEGQDRQDKAITVACLPSEDGCRIQLSDNGPGFPVDKLHRLLEPYVTTRSKGTGLGLAIVKKIADDHKAQLTLENQPDGGACVTLFFSIDSDKKVT